MTTSVVDSSKRVLAGRPIAHVAAEMGISRPTAYKWIQRWRDASRGPQVSSGEVTDPARFGGHATAPPRVAAER
ncbi:helix-turn-helix domain-containing protein [Microtetraspora malaysiensis]|uniref:helix-turn-helix domain-containing protein n=1 Tax=Microtetraspora malaysiensis TaxID=161358 RepID=UPI003D91D216